MKLPTVLELEAVSMSMELLLLLLLLFLVATWMLATTLVSKAGTSSTQTLPISSPIHADLILNRACMGLCMEFVSIICANVMKKNMKTKGPRMCLHWEDDETGEEAEAEARIEEVGSREDGPGEEEESH